MYLSILQLFQQLHKVVFFACEHLVLKVHLLYLLLIAVHLICYLSELVFSYLFLFLKILGELFEFVLKVSLAVQIMRLR